MEEDDDSKVQPPGKITSKEGRRPAEVYRTDLITAMKIPDHQLVLSGSYFNLTDAWKQEWEKGVQVPVNMESLPRPSFRLAQSGLHMPSDFKISNKFIKSQTKEEKKSQKLVSYDLDDEDVEWLKSLNRSRRNKGLEVVNELVMEKVITCLEDQCYTNMGETISTAEGLSIEYDENIACDVCRVLECEDGNEIVFCDVCDVAVHQACYGVKKVPVGSWVCKPCSLLLSNAPCLLCSTTGGALKRSRSKGFQGWVHMSCALWIPAVGIGDVEKMEPITRLETITPGRWNLLCYLCKERKGACIQCSVKTCVTAFHVTCGFNNKLEMQTVLDDSAPDGVRHVCYCYKHGSRKSSRSPSKSSTSPPSPRKTSRPSTSSPSKPCSAATAKEQEEQENLRQKKLRRMEEEFYNFADIKDLAKELQISEELATTFHRFWTLKRKARDDASLLPPTFEQQECLTGRQTKPYQRATMEMERVVKFRHDLERVRNLCYMVEKREKQKRELIRARDSVFRKELEIMDDTKMTSDVLQWARACCTKNFTEYETLQTLDLNYPRKPKPHKRHARKRRRRVKRAANPLSSSDDEVFNTIGEETSAAAIGGVESDDGGDCSEQNESSSVSVTASVDESLREDNGRKPLKTSVSTSEPSSNEDRGEKEGVRETYCASSRRSSRRVEDFSTDSDFEDDTSRKARSSCSKRIGLLKLPKKVKQKNGVIECDYVASSSPGETDRLLNGDHSVGRPGEGYLSLMEINNLKTVDEIKDIVQRSPKSADFNIHRKRLFGEFPRNIDDSGAAKNEERVLRSSHTILDGHMVLDKVKIVLSPKRHCRSTDETVDQNWSFPDPEDAKIVNSEVSPRLRSRRSDSDPPPASPTRTDGALSKGVATDHNSRSHCKPCVVIKKSLPNRCRTRRSSGQSSDNSSSSFGNSTQCSEFFGKFRQTAATSA